MLDRRDFLKSSALFSSTSSILGPLLTSDKVMAGLRSYERSKSLRDISPLINIPSFNGTNQISGDTPDEAHEVFWNKPGFIKKHGGLPSPTGKFDIVIVGGGLAGLTAAYHAKDKNVLMLEGNPRLGGNAKVERYKKTFMSLGSAYVTVPEEGGHIDNFFEDLGLKKHFRKIPRGQDPVLFKGEYADSFWSGHTDPANKDEFLKVYKKLAQIYKNEYPDLPLIPGQKINRKALNQLDMLTLKDWVKREFGDIHPHIKEYFHQYCWSSFSSSYDEISAAQFLNFFTADLAGIQALPGGNGMIGVGVLKKLRNSNFKVNTTSFVVDVREHNNGVYICFFDQSQKKLRAVLAKKCIFAAPKLVAKHIIEGLDPIQHKAMDNMVYHAYLVANVLLKKHIDPRHYDLYSLIGKVPTSEYKDSRSRVFSDITFAHWANQESATNSALTLYLPLPYSMAQQFLFAHTLYEKYSGRIKKRLSPVLDNLGSSWDDVKGIRLTRYGHSVAVASRGGIASGLYERAHKSINNKIFFANQDNWANPCFETSFAVGTVAAYQALGKDFS